MLQGLLISVMTLLPSTQEGASGNAVIQLSTACPPGFEKTAYGACELRSLYELYNSPAGFGGLKTPLPGHRGGYTPEQIDLGRYLFFDPLLSGGGDMSCATCHRPDRGFSDGRARSIGTGGNKLDRSAPSLWNVGFLQSLFWDGRAKSLEEQAQGPLFNEHEMNNTPEHLRRLMNGNGGYVRLFSEAFPGTQTITVELVTTALAAFQSSLISLNSRYDRYAHGDETALTVQEQVGHTVFRSFATRCSQCHTPPLFTNQQLAVTGAPEAEDKSFDEGAGAVMGSPSLRGAFKVPSLRNISLTAPYMHSGALSDLEAVVDFYNNERGHAVKDQDVNLHWHLVNPRLTGEEKQALLAFLHSLRDERNKPAVPLEVPSGLPVMKFDRIPASRNLN